MYSAIIAAVDGSDEGGMALKHARAIAERFRSKLILVHAFPRTSDLRNSIEFSKPQHRLKPVALESAESRLKVTDHHQS